MTYVPGEVEDFYKKMPSYPLTFQFLETKYRMVTCSGHFVICYALEKSELH